MFIVPHGAPEGYEWFVALVVLVGLFFAVCNFMRPSSRKYLKKRLARHDLPDPNPVRAGPGPEKRLRNIRRRFRAVSERHDGYE
jgi:hypothetical protein